MLVSVVFLLLYHLSWDFYILKNSTHTLSLIISYAVSLSIFVSMYYLQTNEWLEKHYDIIVIIELHLKADDQYSQ